MNVNDRIREMLKGQPGVRHEPTKCDAPDPDKRRCPVCKSERQYRAPEFREIACDGIRMRPDEPQQRSSISIAVEALARRSDDRRRRQKRNLECTCDRDPLGVCPEHVYFTGLVGDSESAYEMWNAILADCLKELPGQRLYRVVFELCATCGAPADWTEGECFKCRDSRLVDAEMFAKHGGDV